MICTFLCATCTTKAQEMVYKNEADTLFQQQHYFEAAIAYERVLFTSIDPAGIWYAVNGKVQCLKQQHKYTQAVQFIKLNLTNRLPDTVRYNLLYEQLVCAYLAGSFDEVLSLAEQVRIAFPTHEADKRLLLIRLLSLNELQRWQEAAGVFKVFMSDQPAGSYQNPYLQLPHLKNKDKAQWLSTFIPGAGQWYAGKPLEAIASIILQGAGIYYGVLSFQQHYYLSAWLVGAGLFGSFHMGGVRRSEILVDQYNKKQATRFNGSVKKQLLQMIK